MRQISMEITALATQYVFEAHGVRLTARFFTPVFADDLLLCSRPVSYLALRTEALDGERARASRGAQRVGGALPRYGAAGAGHGGDRVLPAAGSKP